MYEKNQRSWIVRERWGGRLVGWRSGGAENNQLDFSLAAEQL